jgi:hypothetical protein
MSYMPAVCFKTSIVFLAGQSQAVSSCCASSAEIVVIGVIIIVVIAAAVALTN